VFTAFYSFLKQAKLWEMEHAVAQPDPELDRLGIDGESPTLDFAEAKRSRERSAQKKAKRAA
jgi:hypothetical protein